MKVINFKRFTFTQSSNYSPSGHHCADEIHSELTANESIACFCRTVNTRDV